MNLCIWVRRVAGGLLVATCLYWLGGCTTGVVEGISVIAPEIADPVFDGTLTQLEPATVTVSATVTNADGSTPVVFVDLSQVGGQAAAAMLEGDDNVFTWTGTVNPQVSGPVRVIITAQAVGGMSSTADIDVDVAPAILNEPPEISNADVAAELVRNIGGDIAVSANATDPDGTVISVTVDLSPVGGAADQELTQDDNEEDLWTFSDSVTPASAGTFAIVFTATDNEGAIATATASLTVDAAPPPTEIVKDSLGYSTDVGGSQVAKVYVPSAYGGELTISGADVELIYTGGGDLTPAVAGQVYFGMLEGSVVAAGDPCHYTVPQGQPGWYYIRLVQQQPATIDSTYIEEGQASYRPWNGWWWPFNTSEGPTLYDPGGPLDKYDQVYGTQARAWEAQYKSSGTYWSGHCWGWSIASILVPVPQGTTKNGINFTMDDMKGLYTELADTAPYVDQGLSMYGIPVGPPTPNAGEDIDGYCDDVYRIIHTCIGEDSVPVQSNMRAIADPPSKSEEVWNQAIYRYYSSWHEAPGSDDESVVEIDMDLYSNFGPWPPPTDYTDDRWEEYIYQLEFDGQGRVLVGSPKQNWISTSHYPPENLSRLTGSSYSANNPNVTKTNVDALYSP